MTATDRPMTVPEWTADEYRNATGQATYAEAAEIFEMLAADGEARRHAEDEAKNRRAVEVLQAAAVKETTR